MADTVIDWSSRPDPWRDIGPRFREECEAIANGATPVEHVEHDIPREKPDV